ncbi:LamG-like jellyroll fold domain-containing protein [Botryobacter ruber]|uniref:LamG-like jellyroll fold domain-containing protein n=1 Tax=Botryobacter ruber TaxID=2171629 RepID=UPI000E0A6944|nr:LamG-like jellyroll fold domain-containing protein [Botryobacter ruber]
MRKNITLVMLLLFGFGTTKINAQTTSTSSTIVAHPIPHRVVPFSLTAPGISKTISFGADLAWPDEQNFRRAIRFMGLNQVDIVRASFQPTYPLVNGQDLTQEQLNDLNWRLHLINTYVGPNTKLALNCDHPSVDPWYVGYPDRWEKLIQVSAQRYLDAGHSVITVGAFNEPDYGWGQGSQQDMYNITALLKNNPFFSNIRLSGGNTLNCDAALDWYNFLKPAGVNEGNTHQLAGSFDSFANFFQTVRANGHHATDDELHNVVEGLVGYEYGMQTGIWWGPAELARGEMVKAFDGQRLGYAEHRPNWTAAAVYRTPEGKIQAFGGTSERQAVTTTYNYISKDRVVYYDGIGPQREFVLEMPGGTGYQSGQTNAERVINITWGEDIQPAISGRYKLVNRVSGQVLQVDGTGDGANALLGSYAGASTQQWDVTPVDARVGGDFSYYRIKPAFSSTMSLDLNNYSLDNGANIGLWTLGGWGGNQQWYLDYAGDGWFYIRSRESSYCVNADGSGNVIQWEKNGSPNQQWRLLPVGAPIEFTAPSAPGNLVATANAESVRLEWTASPEADVAGYTIFRKESASGEYNTIARNVTTTSFVDNSATLGVQYFYKIKAVDGSLNRSAYSSEVSATPTGANALVAHYQFEDNLLDGSVNLNHSAKLGGTSYVAGKVGPKAIALNGTDAFVQLPADVANQQEITIATWVYWNGGGAWQRIFDFGNSTAENMFLTPGSGAGTLRFAIKNGGGEQMLDAPALPTGQWSHVAVTLGAFGGRLYVNGTLVAESNTVTISPLDFKPVLNYIGRSQYPDPLLNGRIDDFRVYNYALSATEVAQLAAVIASSAHVASITTGTAAAPKGAKYGTVQVAIQDNLGSAAAGATVAGTFSGTFNETVSGVTGTDGKVTLQTTATAKIVSTVDFCVDNVTHASLTYDAAANQITCTNPSASTTSAIAIQDSEGINIYPNPASDVLNINFNSFNKEKVQVSIMDLSGRTLIDVQLTEAHNQLNLSKLESGVYIVKVKRGSGEMSNYKIVRN